MANSAADARASEQELRQKLIGQHGHSTIPWRSDLILKPAALDLCSTQPN
jgi:hypothetical protein